MTPEEVSETIAERFTRVMNATPSPLAPLCDLMVASTLSGFIVFAGFLVLRGATEMTGIYVVLLLGAIPLAVSFGVSASLRDQRARVVTWLASLPFPMDNMNTLLAGLGDTIEVEFASGVDLPTRSALQPLLDGISDDVLLVKERPEERSIEIRLGVLDSNRFPLRSNHQRWARMVDLVTRVLVPLSKEKAIDRVRII